MSKQIFLEHATAINACISDHQFFSEIEILRDRLIDTNSDYIPAITNILQKQSSYKRPEGVSFFQFFLEILREEYNFELSHEIQPIVGVGIIRFPPNQYIIVPSGERIRTEEFALHWMGSIKQGTILTLPNTKNAEGVYEWDFTIVNGSFNQVTIERPTSE